MSWSLSPPTQPSQRNAPTAKRAQVADTHTLPNSAAGRLHQDGYRPTSVALGIVQQIVTKNSESAQSGERFVGKHALLCSGLCSLPNILALPSMICMKKKVKEMNVSSL